MRIFLTLIFSFSVSFVFSQNTKAVFHVTDNVYTPLGNATINIVSKKDSTYTLNKISDTLGNSSFTIPNGTYKIRVEMLGYKSIEKKHHHQSNPKSIQLPFRSRCKNDDRRCDSSIKTVDATGR